MNANDNGTMVVEVNGVKLEVDLRTARRIDTLRIGSRVKVLQKQYSSYAVLPGIVVGFEPFKEQPSIVVCCLNISYNEAKLEFITFNSASKEVEIVAALDNDILQVNQHEVNTKIEREIAAKEREIEEARRRQKYFNENFAAYFAKETVAA